MKRILLSMGIFAAAAAPAFAGNELGNGGDGYAQEFVALGRMMAEQLAKNPDPAVADPAALSRAVEETLVVTRETLQLDGNPVDAINYPESRRIELNRSRWQGYSTEQKRSLVLHEYLGIARIDDSRYQISGNYSAAGTDPPEGERRRAFVGVGSGIRAFNGNIGKLYSASGPALDIRAGYVLSPHWLLVGSYEKAAFHFVTSTFGYGRVGLQKAGLAIQYHFFRSKQWTGEPGVDPYLVAGGGEIFRRQTFQELNQAVRDNATSLEGGLGASLHVIPKRASLWVEARIGEIFFGDRHEGTFVDEGVPNTTGKLLSGGIGFQYYF